mmetsp:Transcript_10270/g.32493  ORF Transcript_10270/g.32493 Transcript_10270/m.32493 type:complete len:210 (-) Transcript_10270:465-1094(-)
MDMELCRARFPSRLDVDRGVIPSAGCVRPSARQRGTCAGLSSVLLADAAEVADTPDPGSDPTPASSSSSSPSSVRGVPRSKALDGVSGGASASKLAFGGVAASGSASSSSAAAAAAAPASSAPPLPSPPPARMPSAVLLRRRESRVRRMSLPSLVFIMMAVRIMAIARPSVTARDVSSSSTSTTWYTVLGSGSSPSCVTHGCDMACSSV